MLTIPGRDRGTEDEEQSMGCLAMPPDHGSHGCKPAQDYMNAHVHHWLQHTHTAHNCMHVHDQCTKIAHDMMQHPCMAYLGKLSRWLVEFV